MNIKLCQQCKRPFLAAKEFCPHCPAPPDADSWAGLGCLLLTILPLFLMILFWFLMLFGVFIH